MKLNPRDIARMMDLSCVRTYSSKNDIEELVRNARIYEAGQVSVLQCFIPVVKDLLRQSPDIRVVGNVSFPSGSDTTTIKIAQAKEMVAAGCDEIDVVMNVGKFLSGEVDEVTQDLNAVITAASGLPVKVIIERSYLSLDEVKIACEICIKVGATFVKTGTGWADQGTTIEDIKWIKSVVGDRIQIKASGGIRDLETLVEMYRQGARRFGVNLKSGKHILEECIALGGEVALD
jgi:deoxyribose-phosphate aldolase